MYTAQDIFNMSIVLMDELSDSGTIDPNQTREYRYKAPYLLDMWQREIGDIENTLITEKITDLSQELPISEKNCPSGAYYLAQHFAMADQNTELAALCGSKYAELKRKASVPLPFEPVIDVYGLGVDEDE